MKQFEKLKQRWIHNKAEQVRISESKKQALLEQAQGLFKSFGIQQVYLFGSVADQRAIQSSDIDLYVYPLANADYWHFRFELEEALQMPVDLYTDGDDPALVKKIISRGELVYEV